MEASLHLVHGYGGGVLDGMSNCVRRDWLFLSKEDACVSCNCLGVEESVCDRDGVFNLIVIKPTDKDGMMFDKACSDD